MEVQVFKEVLVSIHLVTFSLERSAVDKVVKLEELVILEISKMFLKISSPSFPWVKRKEQNPPKARRVQVVEQEK
jgi:hypothetical protein